MPSKTNIDTVSGIKSRLSSNSALIFFDYRGMTAEQVKGMKRDLLKKGGRLHVVKNRLFNIALKESNMPDMTAVLKEPTAVIFCNDDLSIAADVINAAGKKYPTFKIKGGIYAGAVLQAQDVLKVASLPSREVLLSRLVGAVQGPISNAVFTLKGITSNLVYTLSAVKEKKEKAA
ncbi:MAG: 50S ribosomal protein L10 [Spirochaetes bacterium]|nr:50S ribosomal protein L10 [Spirochaetota bacterium]